MPKAASSASQKSICWHFPHLHIHSFFHVKEKKKDGQMEMQRRSSPLLTLFFLLFHLLFVPIAGHKLLRFHGIITPGRHFVDGVHNTPVGYNVQVRCVKGCDVETKGKLYQSREAVYSTENSAGARFGLWLQLAPGRDEAVLAVTVRSADLLGGKRRWNRWELTTGVSKENVLHRFQLGHFKAKHREEGLFLSAQFIGGFNHDLLVPEFDTQPRLKFVVVVTGTKKGIIGGGKKEFARRDLTIDEWSKQKAFWIELGTDSNKNIVDYLRSFSQASLRLAVVLAPVVSCALCGGKDGTLQKFPECEHFVHRKCVNKLGIQRPQQSQQKGSLLRRFSFQQERPDQSRHHQPAMEEISNELSQHDCPVENCHGKYEVHKKKGVNFRDEKGNNVSIQEKTAFKMYLTMPILQNGDEPRFMYVFKVDGDKKSRLEKVRKFFRAITLRPPTNHHNGGVDDLALPAVEKADQEAELVLAEELAREKAHRQGSSQSADRDSARHKGVPSAQPSATEGVPSDAGQVPPVQNPPEVVGKSAASSSSSTSANVGSKDGNVHADKPAAKPKPRKPPVEGSSFPPLKNAAVLNPIAEEEKPEEAAEADDAKGADNIYKGHRKKWEKEKEEEKAEKSATEPRGVVESSPPLKGEEHGEETRRAKELSLQTEDDEKLALAKALSASMVDVDAAEGEAKKKKVKGIVIKETSVAEGEMAGSGKKVPPTSKSASSDPTGKGKAKMHPEKAPVEEEVKKMTPRDSEEKKKLKKKEEVKKKKEEDEVFYDVDAEDLELQRALEAQAKQHQLQHVPPRESFYYGQEEMAPYDRSEHAHNQWSFWAF